jgi:hypothetical protein
MTKNWHDSWPGIDLDASVVLDPYGTPYGGPEVWPEGPWSYEVLPSGERRPFMDFDEHYYGPGREAALSYYTPYTTNSQNRGGIA